MNKTSPPKKSKKPTKIQKYKRKETRKKPV